VSATQEPGDPAREDLERRLAHAERELDRERARAAERRVRTRELEQTLSFLIADLRATREDIARVETSRAWRIGHGLTRLARRVTLRPILTEGALVRARRRLERLEGRSLPAAAARDRAAAPRRSALDETRRAEGRRELAREIRTRLGDPPLSPTPRVSVVVLTRDALDHVRRLVDGLVRHTDYPDLELVVVDNGSSDGTGEYLSQLEAPFAVRMLRNEDNMPFSEANNTGAAASSGELLLFCNNDVVAFESGWLRELVGALGAQGGGALGATLLHLEENWRDGPTVQHRGVRFRTEEHRPRAFNDGDGEALFDERFGQDADAPAVTAACLLIDATLFHDVGGFTPGYRFGTEDVDLGLKLRDADHSVRCSGRAVLFHEESATQEKLGRDFQHLNRRANRRLFLERWGPRLRRRHRLALLERDAGWTGGVRPHVAITVTSNDPSAGWGDWYTAHELGDALDDAGFRVSYVERRGDAWYELPDDLDYLISLMDPFDLRRVPPGVVTVAWIRNWTDRWLERPWLWRADLILASSRGSARHIEGATGRSATLFPLATNPARFAPRVSVQELAADYVFTGNHWGEERAIQQALAPRNGERVKVFGRGWESVPELAGHAGGEMPYERLPDVYSSAQLVVDDTAGPTLPYGAVNGRVFDALGCGRLPITNQVEGVRDLFDEEFPTWDSPETLRAQLDRLLADDARRTELAERYRAVVLERHTYEHRARELRSLLEDVERRLSWCIRIGPPDWDAAERWGDTHFARALERELRRRGHRCLIQVLDEWEDLAGLEYDVVLHLKGLSRSLPKPGQCNVLWCISHPEMLSGEECDGYDLVLVASERFAAELREHTATPVAVLEQATDPRVFFPDPDPALAHDLVYVANSRGVLRPIARDLLPTERDLAIWGANWDGLIDGSRIVAEHVPNDELRRVYSSAGLVLNDHWDDMREYGFVSNRVYDALACGAVVVSDDVPGLERFGDAVVTYRTREELERVIDELLADQEGRRARGLRGAELVRTRDTFERRVDVLVEVAARLVGALGLA